MGRACKTYPLPGCEGCYYWRSASGGSNDLLYFCAYCYDTGNSRPCEAGEGCIVRKVKKEEAND